MGKPVLRVMIVEDSAAVRTLLEHIVAGDPRLEVCASVGSAELALRRLERAAPDVISMDVGLPGMDGFAAIREIMATRPTPTVVVSGLVQRDDARTSVAALDAGALAVAEKPTGPSHPRHEKLARALCAQLVLMAGVRVVRQRRRRSAAPAPGRPAARPSPFGARRMRAIGIVASTGGPGALGTVLSGLAAGFPLPILVVQHITPSFLGGFVRWLGDVSGLPVRPAQDGDVPEPGVVSVAADDRHLTVVSGRMRLCEGPPVCFQRPSGTVLLESMAKDYGSAALGVVLTGMGEDGAAGARAIRAQGGYGIAESEETAVVFGMPRAAALMGGADESLPLPAIAPRLVALASRARAGGVS